MIEIGTKLSYNHFCACFAAQPYLRDHTTFIRGCLLPTQKHAVKMH